MQANSRVMAFRNMIGTTALLNVKSFLDKFKGPERVEAYVKAGLLYYGEIPLLYRIFEPSAVPSTKEKGGYKVVSGFPRPPHQTTHDSFSPDSQRTVPEPTDPRHDASLLWKTRYQRIPTDGRPVSDRKKPRGGTRANLHRGTSS